MGLNSQTGIFFTMAFTLLLVIGCEGNDKTLFTTNDPGDTSSSTDTEKDSNAHTDTSESDTDPQDTNDDTAVSTDDTNSTGLEDWDMYLTVDNMFDVYFGTPTKTTGAVVGRGDNWQIEYHYTAEGRRSTDYMYVATASDHSVAQGFLGTFTNLTLGKTTNTGDPVWEVFPAGAYEETNDHWPSWPASRMPTQAEVDVAIAFAEKNNLWVKPVSPPGYDNDPNTSIAPATSEWRTHCSPECVYNHIPITARWIWHDSGRGASTSWADPLAQFNHDEFLVFRVAGAVNVVF